MHRFVFLLLVVIGLAGQARAQSPDIVATIDAQIEAFKADDFERAFSYASPSIQRLFSSAENFGNMVQNGFPMVWRPGRVRFLELREIDGKLWQKVMITDAAGRVHLLDCQMIDLESGWKINGVQILDGELASA
ncbi:MAG: DUF4864 domain-containing protein [Rhodobacteraceae bacterium]|nr:MAG: DUF4864 domain-containing protein [Paracoccaceae bacterium]